MSSSDPSPRLNFFHSAFMKSLTLAVMALSDPLSESDCRLVIQVYSVESQPAAFWVIYFRISFSSASAVSTRADART